MMAVQGRRGRWRPLGGGILAALVSTGVAASPPWELSVLLAAGSEVADAPGTRIRELGQVYAVEAQTFALWARVDGPVAGWVLLGFRGGRTEILARERVEEGKAAPGGSLSLARRQPGEGSRLGRSVVVGKGRVYLQEKPLEAVPGGGASPVYQWDAGGLRPVLAPGDGLSFRGTTYRCETVTLGHANASGAVLLAFTTSSPVRTRGLAVHDAGGLRVLLTEDQPLPGTAGARLKDSALGCGTVRLEEAVLADDGTVVLVGYLKGEGGTRKGILAIGENRTDLLVGGGDPCPVPVGGKVRSCPFAVLDARSASLVAAAFTCRQPVAAVWNGKGWLPIESAQLTVDQAVLVATTAPAVLWHGTAEREETRGGEVRRLHLQGWGLFTGTGSQDLRWQGNNPTGFDLLPEGGAVWGVSLQYGWGVQGFRNRFVDAGAPEKGAQTMPRFPVTVGGEVTLDDVHAWLDPDRAIVVVRGPGFEGPPLPAGVYLMSRSQSPQP